MDIINVSFLLIPFLLSEILGGTFLLKKQRYDASYHWILSHTIIFTVFLLSITGSAIFAGGLWGVAASFIPLTISIISMIIGVLLLRKHFYVLIIPSFMSIFFLFLMLLLLVIGFISDGTGDWVLGVLFNELLYMNFYIWGFICTLAVFCFSVFLIFCIKTFKRDLFQCIKYKKENIKLYIYVAGLPSAAFLFFWFQYSVLDPLSADDTFGTIVYLLTQITCAAVFYYLYLKVQTKSIFRVIIYIVCNIMLGIHLTNNKEYTSMSWLFSYYILCFIAHTCYEVKKSQQESIPEKSNPNSACSAMGNICYSLLSYVPLLVMIVCNLIIVACSRANLI